ncbi:RNA methyltransferase [Allostella sp. ATCC 35155]|nr:RNA methyltransferase [Stella sp. ATCC 35155]
MGSVRAFCAAVAAAWWSSLGARIPLRAVPSDGDDVPLSGPAATAAQAFAAGLAADTIEAAASRIGALYSGLLPDDHRTRNGVYYTPSVLVRRLVVLAETAGVDWRTARVLDPACGSGAFLVPIAQRMIAAAGPMAPARRLDMVARRLAGWELDPFAAWLAQVALDAVLEPLLASSGARPPDLITVCDSLRRAPAGDSFDLVIGNPPFGKVSLPEDLRRRYHRSLFGHANLYALFTDASLAVTAHGGVVAFVMPTSFLAGEYFKKFRDLLARDAPPVSVEFVAARRGVFDAVLQETMLATWRRGGAPRAAAVSEIAMPELGGELRVEPTGELHLPPVRSQPWLLPRTRGQAELIERLRDMPDRLADWGYAVSTGPLVWNRHKDQLKAVARPGSLPVIWSEAVTPDGRFVYRAEKRNHSPWFEARPGDDWLLTREACVLLQRTTAKEQARRLIAAPLPVEFVRAHRAVIVENHLNMLRAAGDLPDGGREIVPPEVLAAFLNSTAADQAFRCVSGSVAVSAYELHHLPLPPAADVVAALRPLLAEGAPRREIEAACTHLYADRLAAAA